MTTRHSSVQCSAEQTGAWLEVRRSALGVGHSRKGKMSPQDSGIFWELQRFVWASVMLNWDKLLFSIQRVASSVRFSSVAK